MKRPLECLAGGFVLGEVLALLPVGWMAGILAVFLAGVCYLRKKCGRSLVWWLLPFFVLWGMGRCQRDLQITKEYERIGSLTDGKAVEAEGSIRGIQEKKSGDGLALELTDVVIRAEGGEQKYGNVLAYADRDGVWEISEQEEKGRDKKESAEDLHIGERVRLTGKLERFEKPGNPGEFDLAGYYHAIGIEGRFFVREAKRLEQGYSPFFDGIYRIRRRAGAILDRICAEEDKGIFRAMVLGEKTELSADVKRLYQSGGISHVLAVSGLHISMVGMGCYGLFRRIGLGFLGAGTAGMAVTATYGILAGGTGICASVNRAVFMALMQMGAEVLGRTYDMRTGAWVCGLLLLLRSPMLLFQAGFQLSFGAVMILAMAVPVLEKWLGVQTGWQKTLLAGAALQIGTCPVILFHYFEYPVYGILLNLVVIPLMTWLLLSGLLGVVLGWGAQELGVMAVGTGHYVLSFYRWLCESARQLPGAAVVTGRPQLWQIGAYGAVWCVFLAAAGLWRPMCGPTKRRTEQSGKTAADTGRADGGKRLAAFGVLVCFGLGILFVKLPLKGMEATFLDVGQGDGICIRTRDTVVLVDGGSTDRKLLGTRVLEPFLKSRGIHRVDYAIVSHGDQDHISGLLELLEEDCGICVRHVILPWSGQEDQAYERLLWAAKEHGAAVTWMKQGDGIEAGRLQLDCLYAGREDGGSGLGEKDRNEHSLLLLAKYERAGILLTGDMSEKGEKDWLDKGEYPRAQVLKVAHHGSSYSTGEEFLERVHPLWAVISCGADNRYGHPGEDTIKRLESCGAKGFVTMDTGAITVKTDGRWLEMLLFR